MHAERWAGEPLKHRLTDAERVEVQCWYARSFRAKLRRLRHGLEVAPDAIAIYDPPEPPAPTRVRINYGMRRPKPPEDAPVPPWTLTRAALYYGVHRVTVANWVKKGIIPHFRTKGGRIRIQPHAARPRYGAWALENGDPPPAVGEA